MRALPKIKPIQWNKNGVKPHEIELYNLITNLNLGVNVLCKPHISGLRSERASNDKRELVQSIKVIIETKAKVK